jgi:hypothetical protein
MPWEEISTALGLNPNVKWTAGEPRVTPTGTLLGGIRENTRWSHRLENEDSTDLIEALTVNISFLEGHKDFLDAFVATGGEIEYFVGWFTIEVSSGQTLPRELMRRIADLKIDLGFDIYGRK